MTALLIVAGLLCLILMVTCAVSACFLAWIEYVDTRPDRVEDEGRNWWFDAEADR